MLLVCGADVSAPPPLSCAVIVIVAEPFASSAGVNVSVPFDETAGCVEKSALLLFVTVKVTVCPDSSAGPGEIDVAQFVNVCAPESSLTVTVGPARNDGGSLTGLMVIDTVAVSVPPLPSLAS